MLLEKGESIIRLFPGTADQKSHCFSFCLPSFRSLSFEWHDAMGLYAQYQEEKLIVWWKKWQKKKGGGEGGGRNQSQHIRASTGAGLRGLKQPRKLERFPQGSS